MLLLFIPFIFIVLYKMNKTSFSTYHEEYLGREQTTAMRGIFAVIILFSHMRKYIDLTGNTLDSAYNLIIGNIEQLMVVMFLFYSGYGILESYKRNPNYEKTFLKNRFLKTLIHFDLAVFLFFITDIILGIKYETIDYILCWTGWRAIGNSKWFIFDILALYLFTFASFKINNLICKNKSIEKRAEILSYVTSTGVIVLIALLFLAKRKEGSWWYDTLLSYPCGMLFSCYKKKIDKLEKNTKIWTASFIVCALMFIVFWRLNSFVFYNICTCFFALLVTLITMKVKFANPILLWLGKHSFSIYILQRLPMIIMSHFGINEYRYLFAVLSIVLALLLSFGFEKLLSKIDKKLFVRK